MRTNTNFLLRGFASCSILTLCLVSIMFSGCMKPYDTPEFVTILNNETAFVIPIVGATKANQGKFESSKFLNELKVATKRIQVPHTWVQTGRMGHNGEWMDAVRVLRVDRSPSSREWTVDNSSGTANTDEAIYVESKDSIGFYVGVSITAQVEEANTALYLYRFPTGKTLETVIDENIRPFVQSELGAEFGALPLEDKFKKELNEKGEVVDEILVLEGCKTGKTDVFARAKKNVITHFSDMFGITITNLGHIGGLTFIDEEIQKGINKAYLEEMAIKQAANTRRKQAEINATNLSIEVTNRERAEEFSKASEAHAAKTQLDIQRMNAEANLERAKGFRERWTGNLPSNMMPANSEFLFNIDARK